MDYQNFDCRRFEDEIFESNTRDPFHQRLQNVRSWRDVREYFGLSSLQCDEHQLRDGMMGEKLHDALEAKLGAERLASYFGTKPAPKKTKEQQEEEDLVTMMFGKVNEYNHLRLHRLGKGK